MKANRVPFVQMNRLITHCEPGFRRASINQSIYNTLSNLSAKVSGTQKLQVCLGAFCLSFTHYITLGIFIMIGVVSSQVQVGESIGHK